MTKSISTPTGITLTVLGSGTSTGVPIITCRCPVCRSRDPKDQRTRASVWFQKNGKSILIDTSTDLRSQALREKITRVDAVLYTHPHADHIHGIDELRAVNFTQKAAIPVYGNSWSVGDLHRKFEYAFFAPVRKEGGGIPQLIAHIVPPDAETLDIAGISVIPIPLKHGSKDCLGYRIDTVAYVTDCSYIPPQSLDRLRGLDALVLDCVRVAPKHDTHLTLEASLDVVAQVRPKKTFLTHLGHEIDAKKLGKKLPKGVAFAFDGLKIRA